MNLLKRDSIEQTSDKKINVGILPTTIWHIANSTPKKHRVSFFQKKLLIKSSE